MIEEDNQIHKKKRENILKYTFGLEFNEHFYVLLLLFTQYT